MRQIKFRGLRTDGKGWMYGDLVHTVSVSIGVSKNHTLIGEDLDLIEVHSDTVGQFTGLKDRNGKEIYEGDILQYHQHDNFIVSWDSTFLGFSINGSATGALIISTIHDRREVTNAAR